MTAARALLVGLSAVLALGVTGPCGSPTAPAASPPLPDPEISLTVNGTGAAQITRGAAVLVDVLATHPNWPAPGVGPIPLRGSPSWASLVRLEVTASDGSQVSWPVTLQPATPASLTLDGSAYGTVRAYVTPADSSLLAPGSYAVEAVLDASTAPGGAYQGVTRSTPLVVVVSDAMGQPTPAEDEASSMLDARYRLRVGDVATATSGLTALLSRVPDSVAALALLSDLDRSAGRTSDALLHINQAIKASRATDPPFEPGLSEPPNALLASWRDLVNAKLRAANGNQRPAISARITAKAPSTTQDVYEVDVTFTNTGSGPALDARATAIRGRVLQGIGSVALDSTLGPALPIDIGGLDPGASMTVRLYLRVDPGVVRYALTEDGATGSNYGTFGFSLTQATYK